jgi:hypothetical protein
VNPMIPISICTKHTVLLALVLLLLLLSTSVGDIFSKPQQGKEVGGISHKICERSFLM